MREATFTPKQLDHAADLAAGRVVTRSSLHDRLTQSEGEGLVDWGRGSTLGLGEGAAELYAVSCAVDLTVVITLGLLGIALSLLGLLPRPRLCLLPLALLSLLLLCPLFGVGTVEGTRERVLDEVIAEFLQPRDLCRDGVDVSVGWWLGRVLP